MTDSEMVERVARAAKDYLYGRADFGAPINFDDLARAAILAMREPTGTMNIAGGVAQNAWADRYNGGNARKAWEAMIDAALSE